MKKLFIVLSLCLLGSLLDAQITRNLSFGAYQAAENSDSPNASNEFITKNSTELGLKEDKSNKGAINGYASLDGNGMIPASELPEELMHFQGNYNATTNSPPLANTDVGKQGFVYRVSVAGTVDFGAGDISFIVGDWVYNTGTVWEKGENVDAVNSVFGRIGMVTATVGDYDADQISETASNKIMTAAERTNLSNQSGTNTGDQIISDATITTTDITTNDVSITKHGFAPKAPNDATQYLNGVGAYSTPSFGTFASSMSTPSDPTGTTSDVGVMMGLAGSITPTATGKILITIIGDTRNSSGGDGSAQQIRYGTGTAPSNGDALTGTAVGSAPEKDLGAAGIKHPFALTAVVTGLTPGVAIWIDSSLARITAGTAIQGNITITVVELP